MTAVGLRERIAAFAASAAPRRVTILWGSQSGTAHLFADQLGEEIQDRGLPCEVEVLGADEFDAASRLASPDARPDVLFLVMAVYGRGEPTENAQALYEWVMDDARTEADVGAVRFAVFGLGSSKTHAQYYNVIGKQMDARLEALGGQRWLGLTLGDDDTSLDHDFEEWQEVVIDRLQEQLAAAEGGGGEEDGDSGGGDGAGSGGGAGAEPQGAGTADAAAAAATAAAAASSIAAADASSGGAKPTARPVVSAGRTRPYTGVHPSLNPFHGKGMSKFRVLSNGVVTPHEPTRPVFELRLQTADGSPLAYETGDYVMVATQNSPARVAAVCEHFGWDPFMPMPEFGFGATGVPAPVPRPKQAALPPPVLEDVLTYAVELEAPASPRALKLLAAEAAEAGKPDVAASLHAMRAKEAYQGAVVAPRLRLDDVDAGGVPVPPCSVAKLLKAVPRLAERCYSISSMAPQHAEFGQLDITFRYVQYLAPGADGAQGAGRAVVGVNTSFLAHLTPAAPVLLGALPTEKAAAKAERLAQHAFDAGYQAAAYRESVSGSTYGGSTVAARVRPATFRLGHDPQRPLIMVAGGVGIAPFRAFVQERLWRQARGERLGPATLFYGTRVAADEAYMDLFETAKASGALYQVICAHSEGPEGEFVPSTIARHCDMVWDLLRPRPANREAEGRMFVCGGAGGLGRAMVRAVQQVAQEAGGMSAADARAFFEGLVADGRYLEDLAD